MKKNVYETVVAKSKQGFITVDINGKRRNRSLLALRELLNKSTVHGLSLAENGDIKVCESLKLPDDGKTMKNSLTVIAKKSFERKSLGYVVTDVFGNIKNLTEHEAVALSCFFEYTNATTSLKSLKPVTNYTFSSLQLEENQEVKEFKVRNFVHSLFSSPVTIINEGYPYKNESPRNYILSCEGEKISFTTYPGCEYFTSRVYEALHFTNAKIDPNKKSINGSYGYLDSYKGIVPTNYVPQINFEGAQVDYALEHMPYYPSGYHKEMESLGAVFIIRSVLYNCYVYADISGNIIGIRFLK